MATFASIWPYCGAPAWYKLWYTFACNLRISFICYFQRETQFSFYISRCQLDDFVLESGNNYVNYRNMWYEAHIICFYQLALQFAKSRLL